MITPEHKMKNPFLTYGYAGPEYFCDRKKETARLTTLLENGNHSTEFFYPKAYYGFLITLHRHCEKSTKQRIHFTNLTKFHYLYFF